MVFLLWVICVFCVQGDFTNQSLEGQFSDRLVFLILLRLFIAALLSPAGKGLASWLLLAMFIVFVLLFHVVSWVRCGT